MHILFPIWIPSILFFFFFCFLIRKLKLESLALWKSTHVALSGSNTVSMSLWTQMSSFSLCCGFLGGTQRLSNSLTAGPLYSGICNHLLLSCLVFLILGPCFLPELASPSFSEWDGFHWGLSSCLVSPGRSLVRVVFALSLLCSRSPSVFRSGLPSIQNRK